ncbi:Protein ecdysoneless-like protein [Trichoplax sp. H2]|nr:Protein ecdysoneless-like protein [Trichoplax sp. H2]|eukprot:RDD39873.1 Protein ecdysoneless-like protein [Trichoplax sp. H2]
MENLSNLKIAGNTVEYRIYSADLLTSQDVPKCNEQLQDRRSQYITYLGSYLVEYIWHNESFNLRVIPPTAACPAHLYGSTEFADNIDDEWFIVFLLWKITSTWDDVIVSIWDNDEQFLLIEAANDLPSWLEPNTSDNRVFIYNGLLQIIPLPNTPAELSSLPVGQLSIGKALAIVTSQKVNTVASSPIQQAILNRIEEYPEKLVLNKHRAHLYVPANVAYILKTRPGLLSPAVQAFYERDPLDLKVCRLMKHFPPDTCIKAEITFTRCLYAQLLQQKFKPDKRSSWKLPSQYHPEYKAYELGMKLACGFEILCSRHESKSGVATQQTPHTTRALESYLSNLKKHGYFQNEIEGSQKYQMLLDAAKQYFINPSLGGDIDHPGCEVLNILRTANYKIEDLKRASESLQREDDDSWLELSSQEVDSMIEKAKGNLDELNTEDLDFEVDDEESKELGNIASGMKSFISKISGYEGAEFPSSKNDCDVDFDPDAFLQSIYKFTKVHINDNDDLSEQDSDNNDDIEFDSSDIHTSMSEVQKYMDQMDQELAPTTMGKSFTKAKDNIDDNGSKMSQDNVGQKDVLDTDDLDNYKPIDVDINLVKNILESYSAQQGLPGPATNILQSMNIKIPDDAVE